MKAEMLARLNRINQEFYQDFAGSFSLTRRKIQPGVSAILNQISEKGNWLDIGCGNGNLTRAWAESAHQGFYCGIDFSSGLIADAREKAPEPLEGQEFFFQQVDLSEKDWFEKIPQMDWDGIFFFAVLHHIPGRDQRSSLCMQVRDFLYAVKTCFISVWQPLNSQRLTKRIIPWESIGVSKEMLDTGDVLLDWRAHQVEGTDQPALRYVHIFSEGELKDIAQESGFSVSESYYSDGKEGNLGLYQHWEVDF
jgi:SAM-dependent methyltransferase